MVNHFNHDDLRYQCTFFCKNQHVKEVCESLGWDYSLGTVFFVVLAWFLENLHPWSIYFFPITIGGFFLLAGAKSSKKWLLIVTLFIFILYFPVWFGLGLISFYAVIFPDTWAGDFMQKYATFKKGDDFWHSVRFRSSIQVFFCGFVIFFFYHQCLIIWRCFKYLKEFEEFNKRQRRGDALTENT